MLNIDDLHDGESALVVERERDALRALVVELEARAAQVQP